MSAGGSDDDGDDDDLFGPEADFDDAPETAEIRAEVQPLPIIGQEAAEHEFLTAYNSGRLHHAWLLTGPQGVGKGSFARRAARFLLSPRRLDEGGGLFGAEDPVSLDVAPDDPAGSLIDAGSHPGLLLLERLVSEKTGKRAANVSVDQVRALAGFVSLKSADGGWRIILIDAMDDLNRAASNAVLKLLEEPPSNTLFFLISHQPGSLLPTIRSRCRRLEFRRLTDAQVGRVLIAQLVAQADLPMLQALADGAPGQALRFAGLDLPPLAEALDAAMAGTLTLADRLVIAEQLGKVEAAARYEAFLDLAQRKLADALRASARAGVPAPMALWEQLQMLVGPAVALNDDPKAITYQTLGLLSQMQHGTAAA